LTATVAAWSRLKEKVVARLWRLAVWPVSGDEAFSGANVLLVSERPVGAAMLAMGAAIGAARFVS
jgi:hypothetical protein